MSSMLLVAVTPSGSLPMISPTSLPALSLECTQQPASSSSGCSSTPLIAATPTEPVAHCTTRNAIAAPPGKLEQVLAVYTSGGVSADGRNCHAEQSFRRRGRDDQVRKAGPPRRLGLPPDG